MSRNAICLNSANLNRLRGALLDWYDRNRRDLPWRRDADPYRIWVVEIMLQQTRVAAVLDHYARFLRRFPTVQALAAARLPSVLAAWSGLGYYHRARRMHQAAKLIVSQRHGEFPRTAEQWHRLPGIGRYTAAAIASIACGEAVATVDGNVERVLGRISGCAQSREVMWQCAQELLDHHRPGEFNQAMMELGATICTPRAPLCDLCPLRAWCQSRGANAARPQAARKRKQVCYALARRDGEVLLVQRPMGVSLMAGMWELPAMPKGRRNGQKLVTSLRHSITDTDYDVSVISVAHDKLNGLDGSARWFSRRQWERLPLTGLTRKVLRRLLVESGGRSE